MALLQVIADFKFQSDSINTHESLQVQPAQPALNSNLILLILKLTLMVYVKLTLTLNSNLILLIPSATTATIEWCSIFKFQSDSINTNKSRSVYSIGVITLNSNLILLIPVFKDTFKTTGYNTYFRRLQK